MNVSEHSQTISVLQELRSLLGTNNAVSLVAEIDHELQRISQNHFYLVVLGQFKRGKTTFLNALLGEDLLPAGVLPLTAVLTLIRHGPRKQMNVIFNDDRRQEIQPHELVEFIAEQNNPGNVKQVRYVEIVHPSPLLCDGLVLVDTPGVGSLFQHNTEVTRQFIPKIDAAVLVISTDPPITQTEYEFLGDVVRHVEKVLIVLNKTDRVRETDLREMVGYTKAVIGSKFPDQHVQLLPLSALLALEGKKNGDDETVGRSGIRELERALATFLVHERSNVLQKQTRRRVGNLISRAHFAVEFELKAAQMPITELESKIAQFEQQIARLLREREELAYLSDGEMKSLERWIDEQVERFSEAERAAVTEAIPVWASELYTSSFNTFFCPLEARLRQRIEEDFERFRAQFEVLLMERYDAIAGRYVQKVNGFIESILNLSRNLFSAGLQPVMNVEPIRWERRFYYGMQTESLLLQFDFVRMLSGLLPGFVARRLLLGRLLRSVDAKIAPVSNGLRYEYSYSLQETYRRFRSDVNRQMDEIVKEVRRILQQATERKSATEKNMKEYVEILSHCLVRLVELQRIMSESHD